jgi:hypothetical protein
MEKMRAMKNEKAMIEKCKLETKNFHMRNKEQKQLPLMKLKGMSVIDKNEK